MPEALFSSSSNPSPWLRFVLPLYLPDSPQSWERLANHDGKLQVIAPLLIILRVANRTALTSDIITSGNVQFVLGAKGIQWVLGPFNLMGISSVRPRLLESRVVEQGMLSMKSHDGGRKGLSKT